MIARAEVGAFYGFPPESTRPNPPPASSETNTSSPSEHVSKVSRQQRAMRNKTPTPAPEVMLDDSFEDLYDVSDDENVHTRNVAEVASNRSSEAHTPLQNPRSSNKISPIPAAKRFQIDDAVIRDKDREIAQLKADLQRANTQIRQLAEESKLRAAELRRAIQERDGRVAELRDIKGKIFRIQAEIRNFSGEIIKQEPGNEEAPGQQDTNTIFQNLEESVATLKSHNSERQKKVKKLEEKVKALEEANAASERYIENALRRKRAEQEDEQETKKAKRVKTLEQAAIKSEEVQELD